MFYLFVLLPWLAIKSSRRLQNLATQTSDKSEISRNSIWYSTLFAQGLLLSVAWVAGSSFQFEFFAWPTMAVDAVIASAIALCVLFVIRAVLRRARSDDERRKLLVYYLAPRSAREWRLKILVILAASIAEEVAYRGVAMSIMVFCTGNVVFPVIVCSLAFALAHWAQGLKSLVAIFLIAVAMHVLVLHTGTLVYAIFVHAVYDLVAVLLIWREAESMGIVDEIAPFKRVEG